MKTLKESILSNMEDILSIGDNYDKIYKKAEKDYIKLLNSTTIYKCRGQYCEVRIKSPELVKILIGDTDTYKYITSPDYNQPIDYISVVYDLEDIYTDNIEYKLVFRIYSKSITGRIPIVILSSNILYADINPGNDLDKANGLSTKQCIEAMSNAFLKKYKSINSLLEVFNANISYNIKA